MDKTVRRHSRVRCKSALLFSIVGLLFLRTMILLYSLQLGTVQDVLTNIDIPSSYFSHENSNSPIVVVDTSRFNTSNNECVPVSLLLFGVPKEFRCIWNHYMKYIVQANPTIHFEAHIHMYSDLHLSSFTNAKNNEINVDIESPSMIRSIIDGSYETTKENATKIPTRMVTSSQHEYDEKNLSWVEQRDADELFSNIATIHTLKNIFRQGNSMYEAYQSATSKPFFDNDTSNKTFLFLRSDTLLIQPLIIPCNGLASNEIHIPSWQTKKYPVYNDRTALAGSIAAYKYARAKSHVFPELFLDRRGEEKIQWASRDSMKGHGGGKLHNPERMLMVYLNHLVNGRKIEVKERELTWAPLLRVRSGGVLWDNERWKAPKHLNQSYYCSQ